MLETFLFSGHTADLQRQLTHDTVAWFCDFLRKKIHFNSVVQNIYFLGFCLDLIVNRFFPKTDQRLILVKMRRITAARSDLYSSYAWHIISRVSVP